IEGHVIQVIPVVDQDVCRSHVAITQLTESSRKDGFQAVSRIGGTHWGGIINCVGCDVIHDHLVLGCKDPVCSVDECIWYLGRHKVNVIQHFTLDVGDTSNPINRYNFLLPRRSYLWLVSINTTITFATLPNSGRTCYGSLLPDGNVRPRCTDIREN